MSHATLCFLSFERPQFLPQAIETAIAGAHESVEVIVHDDGSTNPELLKYLYTIHQKGIVSSVILNAPGVNQGQGIALNRMFRMATGDPIIKLDQDLIFHDGWLAKVRRVLQDPRVALCGMFKYWIHPADFRETIIPDTALIEAGIEVPIGHSYHTNLVGSAMAIPRWSWEKFGPFPERWESFGEDWQFQKDVYAGGYFNALPDEDLVENIGFGVGPSTVVVDNGNGPEPRKIHKSPVLVGGGA